MAKLYFTRHFEFTGLEALNDKPEMKKATEDYLGESFFQLRNKVIEFLNPHYDEWNAEYKNLYPNVPAWDETIEYVTDTYARFICAKQDAILKQFDGENPFIVIRSNLLEGGDLMGIGKGGLKEVTIRMYFKQIDIDK